VLIVHGCFRSYCGRKVVVAADLELEHDPQCRVYALHFVLREVSGALAQAFGVDRRAASGSIRRRVARASSAAHPVAGSPMSSVRAMTIAVLYPADSSGKS
jgi:hypothetical protein